MFISRSGEAKRRAFNEAKARQGIDQKAVEAAQAQAAATEKDRDDNPSSADSEVALSDEFRTYELTPDGPHSVTKPWTGFRDLINLSPLELRIMFELFKKDQEPAATKRYEEMRKKLGALLKIGVDPSQIKTEFQSVETKRARQREEFQLKHMWLLYRDFKRVGMAVCLSVCLSACLSVGLCHCVVFCQAADMVGCLVGCHFVY
jgi:hypothetical protein